MSTKAKRPKAQNNDTGERKISSFFKPDGMSLEIVGKKRSHKNRSVVFYDICRRTPCKSSANYALFRILAQVNSNQYSGNNRASLHTPCVVFSIHCCF